MGLKYKASNISRLGSFNGAFRLVRFIWFPLLIYMYIRGIVVILNMFEYNEISVNQLILTR